MNKTKKSTNNTKNKNIYPVCKYIPEGIIKEMKNDVLMSIDDKLERGFRICSSTEQFEQMNNKNTIMLDKCVGTKGCLSLVGECPAGMKKLSFFHTHPKSNLTYPSLIDIMHTETHNYKFLCIGGKDDNNDDNDNNNDDNNDDKLIIRCMPPDVPIVTPQTERIELDWFKNKWKKEVSDCIIDV